LPTSHCDLWINHHFPTQKHDDDDDEEEEEEEGSVRK